MLDQASQIQIENAPNSFDMSDYVVSLREGIMDAWAGAIIAMQAEGKVHTLKPYIQSIFRMIHVVAQDQYRSEALIRSTMGVIGDLAEAFPNGEFVEIFREPWLMDLIKDTRSNRDYSASTIDTTKWAREQVKRQTGGQTNAGNFQMA